MYELHSGACLVQERGLWGTNRTPKRVRYRRRASGVQTAPRNVFGTGEDPLGYKPHSETCSVQEKILWGTNRTPERVWCRRGASGVRTALETCSVQERGLWGTNYSPENVWYRRGVSGVRTTLRKMFGTGEGLLMYGMLHKTPLVQENGF